MEVPTTRIRNRPSSSSVKTSIGSTTKRLTVIKNGTEKKRDRIRYRRDRDRPEIHSRPNRDSGLADPIITDPGRLLTALVPFATLVRVVHVPHRPVPGLADGERRRLLAPFPLAAHRPRAGRARAHGTLVRGPRVADVVAVAVARFAPVLGHAHAVVEHLSGRARAHFRRQVFARRLARSERLVIVARLLAAGRTGFVQQAWARK